MSDPTILTYVITGSGALAALVAAGVSIASARNSARSLRQAEQTLRIGEASLRQGQEDSRERSRPVIVAELHRIRLSHGMLELAVKNYGPSVARNVRVTFDPQLPDLQGADAVGKVTPALVDRYRGTIPMMAPGMKLSNVYFVGQPGADSRYFNSEPLPDKFTVTISYEGPGGRQYADEFHLDVRLLLKETSANPSNTDARGMDRRRIEALETIARGVVGQG